MDQMIDGWKNTCGGRKDQRMRKMRLEERLAEGGKENSRIFRQTDGQTEKDGEINELENITHSQVSICSTQIISKHHEPFRA